MSLPATLKRSEELKPKVWWLAKSIVASADDVKSARRGRCCGLRFHLTCQDFLKTRSRHDRRNSSEKRTSLHGTPLVALAHHGNPESLPPQSGPVDDLGLFEEVFSSPS